MDIISINNFSFAPLPEAVVGAPERRRTAGKTIYTIVAADCAVRGNTKQT